MRLTLLATAFGLAASAALAAPPGLMLDKTYMPHHDAMAVTAIWYPGDGSGTTRIVAENPVFQGVEVSTTTRIAPGAHPVVLFSHGMGGMYRTQAWLAAGLAARGAIVLAVNHPNSTWGDFDMGAGVHHWTRAQDLSTALDALLAQPDFAGHIDTSRVMAAGFSFGGWTALSLGGVRGNHAGTVAAYTRFGARMEACEMLLSERVNLQGVAPEDWNGDYADPRVTHVTAIDPGFVWGLEPADVAGLSVPTQLIGFGDAATRMLATDFDASGLRALLPEAQAHQLVPGVHFTAMPLCKPAGAAILAAEEDDPVCTDPDGTDRAAVHDAIIALIADQLGL
ncbi:putative dienelactone hydrolase [Litoreibacter ponti]|uniref:Putative dienelactone hydrolase n=1 Tax=Litoreibacter ponti TaxID=1510457 RepID=A0A2T6BLY5_9RHOB|nr:hypothetical protein [Litoreibacter ponti]PTX57093.1 putative dienelactone hydrolase [Litoreibacter ponti]